MWLMTSCKSLIFSLRAQLVNECLSEMSVSNRPSNHQQLFSANYYMHFHMVLPFLSQQGNHKNQLLHTWSPIHILDLLRWSSKGKLIKEEKQGTWCHLTLFTEYLNNWRFRHYQDVYCLFTPNLVDYKPV